MKYRLKLFYILLIMGLLTVNLYSGEAGKNGFTLLKMEVDARAAAMGGAYTAVAEDASAVFWNPAGLAGAPSRSFVVMHHAWIADYSHEFAAAHLLAGKHNLALSVNLLSISDIEIRGNVATEEPDGTTEAINFAGMVSYATCLLNDYAVGINVKYLFEKLYLEKAAGWAIDLGFKKKEIITGTDLGITIQNIGYLSELKEESTPLPLIVRGGLGYHVPIDISGNVPLLSADVQFINDEDVYYHLGSQLDLLTYFTVRFGWVSSSNLNQPTLGFSINYSRFHFDYSYASSPFDLDASQYISIGFLF